MNLKYYHIRRIEMAAAMRDDQCYLWLALGIIAWLTVINISQCIAGEPKMSMPNLSGDFVLRYRATTTDYKLISRVSKSTEQSGISDSDVTISSHGGRLLCIVDYASPHSEKVVIYDGKNTYLGDTGSTVGSITPGLYYRALTDVPFPGMSLPYIAFMQSVQSATPYKAGQQLTASMVKADCFGQNFGPDYFQGGKTYIVPKSGLSEVEDATLGMGRFTFDHWAFAKHQLLNGQLIASDITKETHILPGVQRDGWQYPIGKRVHYVLQSVSSSPLPDASYEFGSYWRGKAIDDKSATPEVSYILDSKSVSVDQESARHRLVIRASTNTITRGLSISGTLVIGALMCIACAWGIYRNRKLPMK